MNTVDGGHLLTSLVKNKLEKILDASADQMAADEATEDE